jgi:hypothetical protein
MLLNQRPTLTATEDTESTEKYGIPKLRRAILEGGRNTA